MIYRQYLEAQMANPKVVVLLRVGDFYEIMGENARTVAEELDLTLTSREVGLPERSFFVKSSVDRPSSLAICDCV